MDRFSLAEIIMKATSTSSLTLAGLLAAATSRPFDSSAAFLPPPGSSNLRAPVPEIRRLHKARTCAEELTKVELHNLTILENLKTSRLNSCAENLEKFLSREAKLDTRTAIALIDRCSNFYLIPRPMLTSQGLMPTTRVEDILDPNLRTLEDESMKQCLQIVIYAIADGRMTNEKDFWRYVTSEAENGDAGDNYKKFLHSYRQQLETT